MIFIEERLDKSEYLEILVAEKELRDILKGEMLTAAIKFRGVPLNIGVRLLDRFDEENNETTDPYEDNFDDFGDDSYKLRFHV